METTRAPTHDEIVAEVGKPARRGVARLLRTTLFVAIAALIIGLVVWKARGPQAANVRYLTTAVRRGELSATVSATGTLRGKGTVTVGAEISGRIKALHVDYNDSVQKGQLLAEIDPATIQAALTQSKAQLAAAKANVRSSDATAKEAQLAAKRMRSLTADGLDSKQALEAAEAAADRATAAAASARAQVIVAQATVDSNLTALSKTQIRSPIDGTVLSRSVEVGQALVAAMSTPELFTLARDLRDMEVMIEIDEADVGRTQVGQQATFTVDAWPDRTFSGVLQSIRNVAVTKDNVVTYEALLSVKNDELLLRPGMTATATVQTDTRKGVLLVPNAALRFTPPKANTRSMLDGPPGQSPPPSTDEHPRVWVLREDQPVEIRVQVGLTDGVSTEVQASELHAGDHVITDAEQVGP